MVLSEMTKDTQEIKHYAPQLVNADSLAYIKTLLDNSIDLIVTDPPYFKVKPDGWDNQWKGDEDYLRWLGEYLREFWRVLKPSGSLYLFCDHRLALDIERMVKERFNLLNHIIWAKPSGWWNGCKKESLRAYFPSTERVLFAEHYAGPYRGKDDGYDGEKADLKRHVLEPLISYFRNARAALDVSAADIVAATGKKNMVSHWFSCSQWQLPNEDDYQKLQALFERIASEKAMDTGLDKTHNLLAKQYHELSRTYNDLTQEFNALRRPFAVTAAVPHTDVWTYKPVQFYPGKHPCEKPADMMKDIINASSRPGELVADFFMGSGSAIKQAYLLGRRSLGVELEQERFDQTTAEINALVAIDTE